MSTDGHDGGGWTIDTALQHVLSLLGANAHRYEQRFLDLERSIREAIATQKEAVAAAMAAADRAVQKAEAAAERRFEAVNEFRNTLGDQQRNLIPRAEVDVIVRGLMEKIGALEKQMDQQQAEKLGQRGGWGFAVGVVGFVLTIVSLMALVLKIRP